MKRKGKDGVWKNVPEDQEEGGKVVREEKTAAFSFTN